MQVKKFEAPTIQEALETIKREMGSEAVILQTRRNKKGFGLLSNGSVEVTVAVSESSVKKKTIFDRQAPEPLKQSIEKLPAQNQREAYDHYMKRYLDRAATQTQDQVQIKNSPPKKLTATRYIDIGVPPSTQQVASAIDAKIEASESRKNLESELLQMRRMLNELRSSHENQRDTSDAQAAVRSGIMGNPLLQDAFEQLVVSGIDPKIAMGLVKKARALLGDATTLNADSVMDSVAHLLVEKTSVVSLLSGIQPKQDAFERSPVVIAFAGPTGAGKTTTIAKVASDALINRNLKTALVHLDLSRGESFDHLATYAKILNVPYRNVRSKDDIPLALQDFRSMDLILVDTSGLSQRDADRIRILEEMVHSIPSVRTQLVLPVITRDQEMHEVGKRFGVLRPEALIMTKLDEAITHGAIFNVSQKLKLPLSAFTMGQNVPEDLEEATQERVAALILNL